MAQYWVASVNLDDGVEPAKFYAAEMKQQLEYFASGEIGRFDVPMDLAFRSFDSLIRLVDDLAKNDPQVESTLRRVEKSVREFEENPEFNVMFRGQWLAWKKYMQEFSWDEAKYPKGRGITENLTLMMTTVSKLDEEVRTKLGQLAESKSAQSAMVKEGSHGVADLIGVITPDKVAPDDFVDTEHLTTVCVVVPKDSVEELLECYESLDNFVVPETCKCLDKVALDKDGNFLYRICLFKKSVPSFKQALAVKNRKFIVRDFTYSKSAYDEYSKKKSGLATQIEQQEQHCKMICKAAFADMFLAWMHIKAMRTFVESVLRYGVSSSGSPNFVSVLMKAPTNAGEQARVRTALAGMAKAVVKKEDEEEEFFPYVWLTLTPLGIE